MRVDVHNRCTDYSTYRAARVKSLFNAESGADVHIAGTLDIDDGDWQIGAVVGPSGSGKTTIGRNLWGGSALHDPSAGWPTDAPIVDAIAPGGDFDSVTSALAAVGLGDVPAWLRPFHVLSNGEQFRADLARIVAERPERVVIDEFTSVVDRQIARVGAGAFAKNWRRGPGQAVVLSCHYDVLDWLEPDWVYDTRTAEFTRGSVHRRPRLELEVRQGGWELWPYFKPHHYLAAGPMPFGTCYVGFIDGEPVVHLGMASKNVGKGKVEARGCRLVVMPEWQGAGVGFRFLNHVCREYLTVGGHLNRPTTTLFHTSHPQLVAALQRSEKWRQTSAVLHGADSTKGGIGKARAKSRQEMTPEEIARRYGRRPDGTTGVYFGGHFRAVQGFRYVGDAAERQLARENTERLARGEQLCAST